MFNEEIMKIAAKIYRQQQLQKQPMEYDEALAYLMDLDCSNITRRAIIAVIKRLNELERKDA